MNRPHFICGHPKSRKNTGHKRSGNGQLTPYCRTCNITRNRRYYQQKRAA